MNAETALHEESQVAPVDMLREIFSRQAAFRRRVSDKADHLNVRDWANVEIYGSLADYDVPVVEAAVQRYALCILMEASELMDWTRWKHWSSQLGNKQKVIPGSAEHIREMRVEVADILCFLVNLAMDLGMTADDLNEFHAQKVEVNHKRQDSGTY